MTTPKVTRLEDFPHEAACTLAGLRELLILSINAANLLPEGSEPRTAVIEAARALGKEVRDIATLIDVGLGRLSGTYARAAEENAQRDGWCACASPTRLDPRSMYCSTCSKVISGEEPAK